MQKKNSTDRKILLVALVILFITSGLFYFDDWMWGGHGGRGSRIGYIQVKSGDVRMKFEGDLKWGKATRGQDLVYNDSIYAGQGSEAVLKVGDSEMVVAENTLVVLRKQDEASFLNLSYGSIFGKVAKNEKIMIDTGSGKPIELRSMSDSRIVIRKNKDKTEVQVLSGQAEVTDRGVKQVLNPDVKLVSDSVAPAKLEKLELRLTKPQPGEVIFSDHPMDIDFAWSWSRARAPSSSESFSLQFSQGSQFTKVQAEKVVSGRMSTKVKASQSVDLYYRVRGPNGLSSEVQRLKFVRMQLPLIVQPKPQARYHAEPNTSALVELRFEKDDEARVWYQVAADSDFSSPLLNLSSEQSNRVHELPDGVYFLRARAQYPGPRLTGWSETVPFFVDARMRQIQLAERKDMHRVIIANRNYPTGLYQHSNKASHPRVVKKYLAEKGLLREFFPFSPQDYDQLNITVSKPGRTKEEFVTQSGAGWPEDFLEPGAYRYKYQATKKNFEPSPWSSVKRLEIVMEPPKPIGTPSFGAVDKDGQRDMKWAFTPLLFATSYDIEVSSEPNFMAAREMRVTEAQAKMHVSPGTYYWRARGRDRLGRIISDYSNGYQIDAPAATPQYLAATDPKRKPQSTEKTVTRVERVAQDPFHKNGWWAWLGAGQNYTDYRQSIPGRGTLTYQNIRGPSQYFEGGFTSRGGFGGIVGFKNTPGQVLISNAELSSSTYTWTTASVEGMVRRVSRFSVLGAPVVYGVRLGVQQHKMPFLVLNSLATLDLRNTQMTAASAGVMAELQRRRWTYYWNMRYQFPLAASSDGANSYTVTPVFAFDGSIGTSYNFTRRLKAGLFWYGQWHQYNFVYSDSDITNEGFQSLFYSNIDLRLGFDF